MNLFETIEDLQPYIFRIVDNGGETYDRFTIVFNDGDAIVASTGTICAHVESVDVQAMADNVEAGTEVDLRWIDLPEYLQKAILADTNEGFRNYLEAAPAAEGRAYARDWGGQWHAYGDNREAIYRAGDSFFIRDDDRSPEYGGDGDPGPFETFREAVRYMLPDECDLSGPEYHTTVDLWDETGGPAPLWDSVENPATPYEVQPWAKERDKVPYHLPVFAEARDPEHAAKLATAWREANPALAVDYEPAYINKVDRVVHRLG